MSSVNGTGSAVTGVHLERASAALAGAIANQGAPQHAAAAAPPAPLPDIIDDDQQRPTEHFLPVTRYALADRLSKPQAWPPGVAPEVRRFFRYLDYWRQQRHSARLLELSQAYEPFSPDSDLFVTRQFTDQERGKLQTRVTTGVEDLLTRANYVKVDRTKIEDVILTKESHYGLDLKVDFQVFEELLVFYRGASVRKELRRKLSTFFRKQEFEVPIFRRVFVLFKIKAEDQHIEDVMRQMKISREEATKYCRKVRSHIPPMISTDNIYMKVFKNLPRSDIEMIFPNTQVKFQMKDKVWLGVTGGGALGAGVIGAAGKLALAFSNPVTAAGAMGGIGLLLFRQIMNVMNQKQRYMVIMARNLYFHSMADNRGVMIKLADRAAEEDFKEEVLLYSVLSKEKVNRRDLKAVDEAIEHYVERTFGLQVDFDVADALERLKADGIVSEDADGTLNCLPPARAADRIDDMWDRILDELPDLSEGTGMEIDRPANGAAV